MNATLPRNLDLSDLIGSTAPKPRFSPRKTQILGMVAKGMSYPAIAKELYLSPHTVKKHAMNMQIEMGVHSKTEMVAMALRLGMV